MRTASTDLLFQRNGHSGADYLDYFSIQPSWDTCELDEETQAQDKRGYAEKAYVKLYGREPNKRKSTGAHKCNWIYTLGIRSGKLGRYCRVCLVKECTALVVAGPLIDCWSGHDHRPGAADT